eukprot:Platyproteum_vivax@DN4832_c0_g1_i1.p1
MSAVEAAPIKGSPLALAFSKAKESAFRGGIAGASAQVINVFALMWMRTTMNYQYRYGTGTLSAIKHLYAEGGIFRFYRGLAPALMQSPLCRFGDTAANVGVLAMMDSQESTKDLPVWIKTLAASSGAACFRFFLMPIDAWKTIKQVEGSDGLKALVKKVRTHGIGKLWYGSVAAMGATWVGHYPWFFTHNYLSATLPTLDFAYGKYVRNACIGFVASIVSDCCSNSIRVLKTTKQASVEPLTYPQVIKEVVSKDGVIGLFGRGLKTRIMTNGLQGMLFSVGWKAIQDYLSKK